MSNNLAIIGPLQDPVTWFGINYTGTQMTQWDFKTKGKSDWPGNNSFVLKVPLRHLRPSVIYSVPCDRILQRAIFDEHLTWKSHIHNVARKVSKAVGIIYKSSSCLDSSSLRILHFSLIYLILLRERLGIDLPIKPQKINHTSKAGHKNNVEECFRCSH